MQSLIAYSLALVLIPVVGGLIFVLTLPLMPALIEYSKAYWLITQGLANAARCAAAWAVFYWLGAPFGVGPMLLVCAVMVLIHYTQLNQRLSVYTVYLHAIGLGPSSDAMVINLARRSDEKFQELHSEVGDGIAILVGGLLGVAAAIAVWMTV